MKISLHPAQMRIFKSTARYRIICSGRRMGKTWLCAIILMLAALQKPNGTFWVVSPTAAQSGIMWGLIKKFIMDDEETRDHVTRIMEGEKFIELSNGATIWSKTGDNPDNLRGAGLDGVVLDEAAYLSKEVWYAVIRPMLLTTKGWGMLIGTPCGKNWFYDEFKRGELGKGDYESFKFTSYDNPFIAPGEIEDLLKDTDQLVQKQEIFAEFIESGGEVFANFKAVLAPRDMPILDVGDFVLGVDLAKHQDFTVITVANLNTGLIHIHKRFTHLDWEYQKEEIAAAQKRYKGLVYLDSTGVGDPVAEDLMKAGVPVEPIKFSTVSKTNIIRNLNSLIDQKKILLQNDPALINEFEIYSFRTSPAGNIQYSAPDGKHDDIVTSVALAAWGFTRAEGSMVVGRVQEKPKRDNFEEPLGEWYDDESFKIADWEDL